MSPVRRAARGPAEPLSSCVQRARPVGCRFGLCPVTDGICHGINWFTVTQANELKLSVCGQHRIAAARSPCVTDAVRVPVTFETENPSARVVCSRSMF